MLFSNTNFLLVYILLVLLGYILPEVLNEASKQNLGNRQRTENNIQDSIPLYTNYAIDVNDDNIKQFKQTNQYLLLYFHAEWSNNAERFLNEFQNLASLLHTNEDLKGKRFVSGVVTNKSIKISHKYSVESYPTIILVEIEGQVASKRNKLKEIVLPYRINIIDAQIINQWLLR